MIIDLVIASTTVCLGFALGLWIWERKNRDKTPSVTEVITSGGTLHIGEDTMRLVRNINRNFSSNHMMRINTMLSNEQDIAFICERCGLTTMAIDRVIYDVLCNPAKYEIPVEDIEMIRLDIAKSLNGYKQPYSKCPGRSNW